MAMNMSGAAFSTRRSARSAMPRGRSQSMWTSPSMNMIGKASPSNGMLSARRTALCAPAVAADHGAERCGLRRAVGAIEPDLHVALALIQRRERDAALDLDAELAEMAGQQPLGLVLRQAELAIRELVALEQVVLRRMAVDDGAGRRSRGRRRSSRARSPCPPTPRACAA